VLDVYTRPRVAILSTGDEVIPVEAEPVPGQIRNSNAPMLAALVAAAGGEPWILPTATDTAEALNAALEAASTADLLLITGGVSAGKFDLVEPALLQRGARFHFTGVRMQPGRPVVFGEVFSPATALVPNENSTKYFVGLPGNPISSMVAFLLFAAPLLAALCGRTEERPGGRGPRFALARLKESVQSKSGLTRFFPASCTFGAASPIPRADRTPEVSRVPWQGSGDLAAMARANCFLVVPEESDSLDAGALVRILLI
jgi:molybdopterin molybdotransferase